MGMHDDGIPGIRGTRDLFAPLLVRGEDSWAESSHNSPCMNGWAVNDKYTGMVHYLSMRLQLSLLLIADGISACIYRLRLRRLGSVLSGISRRSKSHGGMLFFSSIAHLSSLFFVSLLFSCLIFSMQADEEVAPNLIHYLVVFSVQAPHY